MKNYCILLSLLAYSIAAWAQSEFTEELKILDQINNNYKTSDDYILDLTFKMNNTGTDTEIDKIAGIYKKKGDKIYYKLGELETGYEEKMNVVADPFKNTIILSKGELYQPVNLGNIKMDIMNMVIAKASLKNISSSKAEITVELKQGDITKVIITYNPQTMLFSQIESFYRRKYEAGGSSVPVKITVTYNSFKRNAGLKRDDFLLAKCLTLNNGEYKLKPAYNTYKLYNTVPKTGSL